MAQISSYFLFSRPTNAIALILQQGLSESSRSRVSVLHSAQRKMAKMVWNEKFGFKGAVKGAANEKFGVQ